MRQKFRRIIIYISLLLFPLTLNYFSPYLSIDGALKGIVAGSIILFLLQFLSGLFLSRGFCSWVCPVAGLSELCMTINSNPVPVRKLRIVRYTVFFIWFTVLVTGFVAAGGINSIQPLYMTERIISVDEPLKFVTYYMIIFAFFGLSIWIGRRGVCHSVCWMSPFLTAGTWLGRKLRLPQLKVRTNPSACVDCMLCNQKCPMSIDVHTEVKAGEIKSLNCIECGECVDVCRKKVLKYSMK